MKVLAKYLKHHVGAIVVCLILLYLQAMTNLYLPNYMANIVDIGIQQGGISEASPKAISYQGFNFLKNFMDDSQKQAMDDSYTLVKPDSPEALSYKSLYPLVEDKSIYVQNDLDPQVHQSVDEAFCRAIMSFIYFMDDSVGNFASDDTTNSSSSLDNVNIENIYKLLPAIQAAPKSQMDSYIQKSAQMDTNQVTSIGSTMCKLFYNELNVDTSKIQSDYIWEMGVIMLLLTFAGAVSAILVGLLAAKVSASVSKDARHDIFQKVQYFSSAEFDKFSTASLITRTTNDVTQIQNLLVMGIRVLCYAPIIGIGGTILALRQSRSMSWIIVLSVVLVLGLMSIVFAVTMPKYKAMQKITDKINLIIRENLSGIMVIRAFGTQKYEENRFDKVNRELTDVNLFVNKMMVVLFPAMMFVMNAFCVIVIWFGGHEIEKAALNVGNMMAFMQYTMMIILSFLMIAVMFIMVPRSMVSANRIAEILDTPNSINDKESLKHIDKSQPQSVQFKNVSFKYGNAEEYVLKDISFTANPGQTTAFIGSTGSGKSTLISLIPRFYDVSSGNVLIGGIDVRDLPQKELRDNIGFVPQKGVLFSGTIASNLRYGNQDASEQDLKDIAQIAQSLDFIEKKDDKFQSPVAQSGSNVSGGQKQRLCIARALAKNAPIYIFDDSFSALDFETDAALRKALKSYTQDSVVLIVAQRISTIMNAQQIIVLDEGRIVGVGSHKQLLKSCEVYKAIAQSQLSKEELLK